MKVFHRVSVLTACAAAAFALTSCFPPPQSASRDPNISIYSSKATVIPQQGFITQMPTMSIWIPTQVGSATPTVPAPTATPTAPAALSEPAGYVDVRDLALPFDPDEIAAILKANPNLHFRYKHRAFVFPNCSTVTNLGEVFEFSANFNEGSPDAPPAPVFGVYAPADMRLLRLWGTSRYRLVLNSRIGLNQTNQPYYLSLLSLTRLDDPLAASLAALLPNGAQPLALDYQEEGAAVGPYLFTGEYAADADDVRAPRENLAQAGGSLVIHKGELIGYKEGPWEWYPTCEAEHTLSIHVFPTTNNAADHTQAVETGVPEITRHYLNLAIRELVIERGVTMDVEYRSRNVGRLHELLARELFDPDVLEQVTLIPWLIDRHPHRFTVAPPGSPQIVFDDETE